MATTSSNPNGLTNAQVAQGYSTIPGNFNPVTGQPNSPQPGQSVREANGATLTNVTGQAPQVLSAGTNKPIPGAPALDMNGNIVPGTGSTQTANSATANNVTSPATPATPAPLTTPTNPTQAGTQASGAVAGANAGIPGLEGGTPLVSGQLSGKYNAALTGLNAGGSTAPVDPGSGAAAANNAAGNIPQSQDASAATAALANDPGYQQLLKDQQMYQSAENQGETLAKQYQDLESQYDIPGLQTQLINMQAIINGTEGDIRTEVTASNGFATNSQVLALSDARNKTLIQNYNQLQGTLTNAQNQVTTMIGLDEKDQENALNAITTKMGIDEQVSDYAQKFQANAKEGYSTIISAVGINGLYHSLMNSDPTGGALASAAQVLGMTPVELKGAADAAQKQQDLDTQGKEMGIASSAQSIASSKQNMQSTALDIAQKKQTLLGDEGVPVPGKAGQQGYTDTGVKLNNSNAYSQITDQWKSDGALDSDNKIPPQYYNAAQAWWVQNGLSADDFKSQFGQYVAKPGSKFAKQYL